MRQLSITCLAIAAVALATHSAHAGGTQVLQNGVPIIIDGDFDEQLFYSINVPAGAINLEISISGGFGDADLYVRFGQPPTLNTWDCRPFSVGNFEQCVFPSPQAGTWHIMINGFLFFSGVTLEASYDTASALSPGVPVTLSGASDSEAFFTIEVPLNASNLEISISGGLGDADLYVRFGAPPSLSQWDCRPFIGGNNETCSFPVPQAGTWWVMVRGFFSYSNVDLVGDFDTGVPGLVNGVPQTGIVGAGSDNLFFTLQVPPGARDLGFLVVGGTGNVDLKVRRGAPPTDIVFDCASTKGLRLGSCVFPDPQPGTYHVRLNGQSDFADITLIGRFRVGPSGPYEINPDSP